MSTYHPIARSSYDRGDMIRVLSFKSQNFWTVILVNGCYIEYESSSQTAVNRSIARSESKNNLEISLSFELIILSVFSIARVVL